MSLAVLVAAIVVSATPAGAAPSEAARPPASASAAPAVEQKPDEPAGEERWYGAPAVASEGAALGLVITGGVMSNRPGQTVPALGKEVALLGGLTWLLGPPLNHALHEHGAAAFGSLGMRLGAFVVPIGTAFLLSSVMNRDGGLLCLGDPPPQHCSSVPGAVLVVGLLGSLVTVEIVDDAYLAREPAPRPAGLALAPRLRLGRDEAVLSLAATF